MKINDYLISIESAAKNPTTVDFVELLRQLDKSIESMPKLVSTGSALQNQLVAAGQAIEKLTDIYRDRATATFDRINWDTNPQQEPIIPLSEFDCYIRQSSVLDLDRFILSRSHYYPQERAAAVETAQIKAEIVSCIIEDDKPDYVAHEEDISIWVQETVERVGNRTRSFSSLSRGKSTVQIWLSILLSNNKLTAVRIKGNFYNSRGIVVKLDEFNNLY